jgi:prevent-host-death family protein
VPLRAVGCKRRLRRPGDAQDLSRESHAPSTALPVWRPVARRGKADPPCATMCYMRRSTVGIRELRQNLTVHLRKVKAGHVLEVTERGVPVAQLTPLPRLSDRLSSLEAAGMLIQRPTKRLEDLSLPIRLRRGMSISKALQDLREERL